MLTLHAATEEFKLGLKILAGIIVVLIIVYFSFPFLVSIKESLFPSPLPPTTATFGKLPHITFPTSDIQQSFSYTINTLSGDLPVYPTRATESAYPDRVSIYETITQQPNLLALDRAEKLVKRAGFEDTPTPVTETEYQWTKNGIPNLTLKLNILSYNFSLTSDYLSLPAFTNAAFFITEKDAKETGQEFLANVATPPDDLNDSQIKTTMFAIDNGSLVPANSIAATKVIRVNFYQEPIDDIPIYYPNTPFSTMTLYIAQSQLSSEVVEADFVHQTIDRDNLWATQLDYENGKVPATYPIKTAAEAFDELKKGNAFIASYNGQDTTVEIHDVKLGYYLGKTPQKYVLPVVVFEGEDNFVAYVEAIRKEYLLD